MAEAQLADLLADCLDALERGEATVEQCLARYPAQRETLEPLLRSALRLRAAPVVTPSPAFRQAARGRLLRRLPSRSAPRRGLSTRGLLGVLASTGALAALLLFVVGAGLFAWLYTARPLEVALGTVVRLEAPVTGALIELNHSLPLQASAQDPAGLTRLEVYADGALVAAQDSDGPEGQAVLLLTQNWVPLTAGRHVLMARAYRVGGGFVDSSVVYVDVVEQLAGMVQVNVDDVPRPAGSPGPSLAEIALAAGLPLADLLAANPPLAGQDPQAPLPAGTLLEVPRPPLPPPGSEGGVPLPDPPAPLPDAPPPAFSLTAVVTCETAALSWLPDGSVEGWTVYRLDPGAQSFQPVAALPAAAGEFEDALPYPGLYHYQLAAKAGGLEGLSALKAAPSPVDCAPDAPDGMVALVISLDRLVTDTAYEGVYCYFSLEGAPYERAPASAFGLFLPDADGLSYNLAAGMEQGGKLVLARHPEDQPVNLDAECRARVGAESLPLGTVSLSQGAALWDNSPQVAQAPGLSLGYRIGANTPDTWIDPSLPLPEDVVVPPVLTGYDLPRPTNLRLQGSTAACQELPDTRGRAACALAGLFGGVSSVLWDWTPNAGYPESALTRFHVVAMLTNLETLAGRLLFERDILPDSSGRLRRATLAPNQALPCGTRLTYTVRAQAGTLMSPPSDPVTLETAPCPRQVTEVVIALESLRLGLGPNGDEGDVCLACDNNTVELRGYYTVSTGDLFATKVLAPDGTGVVNHVYHPPAQRLFFPGNVGSGDRPDLRVDPWVPLPALTYSGSGLYWLDRDRYAYINGPSQNNESVLWILRGAPEARRSVILLVAIDEYDGVGPPFQNFPIHGGAACNGSVHISHTVREFQTVNETHTVDYATARGDVNCSVTFSLTGSVR